jgi:AraC-like DNA-binding protein
VIAVGWRGPRRVEFATANLELAREFFDRTYGGRLVMNGARDNGTTLAVTHIDAGCFSASHATLPGELSFAMSGRDEVIISTMIEGTVQADRAKATDRYQRGDVLIGNYPHADYACHSHNARNRNFTLPVSMLYAVADTERTPSAPLRFHSLHPGGSGARAQWENTARYTNSVLANPEAAASPLILQSTARLLAATALAVFPNTLTAEPAARDWRDASPATLRRAIAFIDDQAEKDISVADIAAAANVSIRAVQLAFRRHLDTTPLRYLRRVRLARAHAQLLTGDPASESVTAVAYRWGFSSPSRFAASYRRAYGVTPSQALRQD